MPGCIIPSLHRYGSRERRRWAVRGNGANGWLPRNITRSGMLLLAALQDENRTLGEFLDEITPFPQVQLNVRVTTKPDLRKHARVGPAVSEIEQSLGERGRVVLRYSGTEPVARIMVEGLDADAVQRHAERLAGIVAGELGEG